MFFTRSRPPRAAEDRLRSLWLAVNTPDLAADELPSGPARAAIAVCEEATGAFALSVLVRSLGDGSLACWSWDGAIDAGGLRRAADAALSFAESMGFLFDDDALSSPDAAARRRALDFWWEVTGWSPTAREAPRSAEAFARAAGPESAAPAAAHRAPESVASAAAPPPERLPLTKFRRRLGAAPAEPPASRPEVSTLGRVRLVKRARPDGTADRRPFWLRLLGSF